MCQQIDLFAAPSRYWPVLPRHSPKVHARELDELIAWGKEALDELRKEEIQSAARADELREHERRRSELDE